MWIVAIAWMYVALLMALAEATSTQGSILGAIITFVMYGVGPLALVMYLIGTPAVCRISLLMVLRLRSMSALVPPEPDFMPRPLSSPPISIR